MLTTWTRLRLMAQDIFLLVFFLLAIFGGMGCTSYHTAVGFWRDVGKLGDAQARKAHLAQQKIDHGRHGQYYEAYGNPVVTRVRSLFADH